MYHQRIRRIPKQHHKPSARKIVTSRYSPRKFPSNHIGANPTLLVRIRMRFLLATQIQSSIDLLLMHLIQILQQHISVSFLALVPAHVVAPAPDGAGQAIWHIRLLADIGDGVEVRSDSEDDTAGSRQPRNLIRINTVIDSNK